MDFTTITPIRFQFAFEAPEQARRIPGYTLKQSRRRMAQLAEARDVLPHLPEPGESLHCLLTGRFDLLHLLLVILERKPTAVEHMRLATLSYSGKNLAELLALVDGGRVRQLSLICSAYFARHGDKDLFVETVEQFRKRGLHVAAPRCHAKVFCLDFVDGQKLAAEGSPNLRSNGNFEQLFVANDAGLHDWHSAWIDNLVTTHAVNQT
jgi:hypothetical protein